MPSFHDAISPLDAIVLGVLKLFNLPVAVYNPHVGDTRDTVAARNAHTLLRHFDGRKIHFIKAIRTAFGIGLKDAKEAMEAIYEAYPLPQREFTLTLSETAVQAIAATCGGTSAGGLSEGWGGLNEAYEKTMAVLEENGLSRKYSVRDGGFLDLY